MYELERVGENSYYIHSPAKIGLYRINEAEVCLIDSGSDKDAGRKVRQILERENWTLRAIYNTHSNADHVGGNRYLQNQTGCKVFAPGIESAITRYPLLEPSFLYGGFPPRALRHKFLMAQESGAEALTDEALPQGLKAIPLPGHFFDMAGFSTDDGVIYLADCLSGEATLEKYQISFLYDVAAYIDTLEKVKTMQAKLFVPAHAAATADIAPLAQRNIDKVREIAARIVELCEEARCFEDILQSLFRSYGLVMNFEQYALVGSTVRSYLAYLLDAGLLEADFSQAKLLWRAVKK